MNIKVSYYNKYKENMLHIVIHPQIKPNFVLFEQIFLTNKFTLHYLTSFAL